MIMHTATVFHYFIISSGAQQIYIYRQNRLQIMFRMGQKLNNILDLRQNLTQTHPTYVQTGLNGNSVPPPATTQGLKSFVQFNPRRRNVQTREDDIHTEMNGRFLHTITGCYF